MTDLDAPTPVTPHYSIGFGAILRRLLIGLVITAGIVWFAIGRGANGDHVMDAFKNIHPHGPDMALLGKQPAVVLIHMFVAILAFGVGLFQLVAPQRTIPHRIIGWAWIIFMTIVAVSSLFIRQINHGHFSYIHILTAITLIQIPVVVYMARTKRIQSHAATALGLFMGALLIAGLLTFIPGPFDVADVFRLRGQPS